jgi:peptidyl-tRNA hydrolase
MAATLNDIISTLKSERYKRQRFGVASPAPKRRSVIDLSLAEESPAGATLSEIIGHCMRPIKQPDR